MGAEEDPLLVSFPGLKSVRMRLPQTIKFIYKLSPAAFNEMTKVWEVLRIKEGSLEDVLSRLDKAETIAQRHMRDTETEMDSNLLEMKISEILSVQTRQFVTSAC